MAIRKRTIATAMSLVGALCIATGQAIAAKPVVNFENMIFIVGFGVGGSYDRYSRLVSEHMSRFLPGTPTIIVQNTPGAGSIRATNHLYSVAPADGSVIGMIDQAIQAYSLMGREGLQADVAKFNWIGRLVSNSAVLFAWHTAPVKTIEDALTKEFIVSASGQASRLNWVIMNAVIGTKMNIITGYKGTAEAILAMERGEIHGLSRPWSGIKAQQGEWLEEGKIRLLLQTGLEKNEELPNVPRMLDLAKNAKDRELLRFFAAPSEIGRSVVAPPGVPNDVVDVLREAFWNTLKDPQFQTGVRSSGLDLDPLRGEKLQALVAEGAQVPPDIVERAKNLVAAASATRGKAD